MQGSIKWNVIFAPIIMDLSCASFLEQGDLLRVDYAAKAVARSPTVLAIRGATSVVLATGIVIESSLFEDGPCQRIFNVDKHIGIAVAGYLPDGRAVVEVAVNKAFNYRKTRGRKIPLRELVEHLSNYMHTYTSSAMVRPFGAAIILAAWVRDNGAELYKIEPSGVSYGYYACSSGKQSDDINAQLNELNLNDMTTDDIARAAGRM